MKIGCLSDTHKNIKNLNGAIEFLKNSGAETIIHLGDDFTDIDECGEENAVRVPGVFSDTYQNPDVPNRRVEDFAGWRVLLTHTISSHPNDLPGDIRPEQLIENRGVDVVLYGHTHIPDIKREQGILFVNPGHLKDEDKRDINLRLAYSIFQKGLSLSRSMISRRNLLSRKALSTRRNDVLYLTVIHHYWSSQ